MPLVAETSNGGAIPLTDGDKDDTDGGSDGDGDDGGGIAAAATGVPVNNGVTLPDVDDAADRRMPPMSS